VIAPTGPDLDAFWAGLLTGADGISAIERFPVHDLRVSRGGEIKKFSFGHPRPPRGGRAAELLLAAADDLRGRVALDVAPERLGIVVGTALGGVEG
jgi:3-oxoacyl-[acyl-carrier-protein] synthase II